MKWVRGFEWSYDTVFYLAPFGQEAIVVQASGGFLSGQRSECIVGSYVVELAAIARDDDNNELRPFTMEHKTRMLNKVNWSRVHVLAGAAELWGIIPLSTSIGVALALRFGSVCIPTRRVRS